MAVPSPQVPDLAAPIRNALLASEPLTAMLAQYLDGPAVFTRRPAPADAGYPMIMVSGNIAKTDQDGIDDLRPIITRDIAVYGRNDSNDNYRDVATMGDMVFSMFHHVRDAITIDTSQGWCLVDIHCTGPIQAPAEDEIYVGRIVTMRIMLANEKGE